uniref:Secreted protein n=1 Tax=Anopheles atroparvus TaxID=41427 RepID=A0A182J4N8_ANOAO
MEGILNARLALICLALVCCLAKSMIADMDQMEEMEVLGLVGCNHAVTVTALPLPGFTNNPHQSSSSESEPSRETNESDSASKETMKAREIHTVMVEDRG